MVRLNQVVGSLLLCSVVALSYAVRTSYVRMHDAQQRLFDLHESYDVVKVQEHALPEREVVYGLDKDRNGSIDHIVLAQWTTYGNPAPTFQDYTIADPEFAGFLKRLHHD